MAGELTSSPKPSDHARWLELVSRLDIEVLMEAFMTRLDKIAEYGEAGISHSERDANSRVAFEQILERVRGNGDEAEFNRTAFALGAARARSGIARATLSMVINFDYLVIWNALVAVTDPDDAALLLRHAGLVWGVVEEYGRAAQEGYLAERERISDEQQLTQRALIAELIDGDPPPQGRAQEIAKKLGLPFSGPFVILAATGVEAVALRHDLTLKGRLGDSATFFYLGSTLLLIMTQTMWTTSSSLGGIRDSDAGAIVLINSFDEIRVGSHIAHGLALLPPRADGRRRSFDDWPQLVRYQLQDTHLETALDFDAKLAACSRSERALLEESIRAYLATGSVRDASERLFCHRNTLTNRMRRFTELTGLDVTVPIDAARVVLAWA